MDNKPTPLVSVCIQTYNQENYISVCLNGILMQQTNFPFEIILGEDESNDGTRSICKAYAEKHPDKIKLYLRSRKDVIYINGNATGRFNMIENLKSCNGKYIAMCEGDDYWTDPLKLQKQVDFLERNKDCSFSFHKATKLKEKEHKFDGDYPVGLRQSKYSAKDFFSIPTIPTCSVMFRNDFAISFLPHTHGDFQLYCQLLSKGLAGFIDETLAVYRLHDKGISAAYNAENYQVNRIKELFIEAKHPSYAVEVRSAIKKVLQNHLEHYLNSTRGKGPIFNNLKWYLKVFFSMYFISLPRKRKFRLLKSFVKSI